MGREGKERGLSLPKVNFLVTLLMGSGLNTPLPRLSVTSITHLCRLVLII